MTESKKIDPKYAITFSEWNIQDVREVAKEGAPEVLRIFRAAQKRTLETGIGKYVTEPQALDLIIERVSSNMFMNPENMEDWLLLRCAIIDEVNALIIYGG